ncbi:MAG: hypothetical protein ACKV2T_05915 [Kofleriaceae bacterium]
MAFSFRPGFSVDVAVASDELVDRLATTLVTMPVQLRRTRVPGGGAETSRQHRDHLIITVPADKRHFWSPWLTVEIEPRSTGSKLSALFSPHPSIWTGYMFGYLGLGIVVMFSLIFAGSVAMTDGGGSPWSLWVAGGAVMCGIGMWWASSIGQRLASTQMDDLRTALENSIEQVTRS